MTSTSVTPKITHPDIVSFAESSVNLKREDVQAERSQVNRLREKLADHIARNPEFDLVKMFGSGSLAKGTALKTINDVDVAVYVRSGKAPTDESELLSWMADRLRDAYGATIRRDAIQPGVHAVTISFQGTHLDVDVVPVLYEDDPEWYGNLVTDNGDQVLTCIPRHLEFIAKRKRAHPVHFRQLIRLVKWWAKQQKAVNPDFRFKSFMIELIIAKMFDDGLDGSAYPEALEKIFSRIATDRLKTRIAFEDYYRASALPSDSSPIQVFDPVNPVNNVASRYDESHRTLIADAAMSALEAIAYARYATTKSESLVQWRKVFGPGFST
jgi:Second Messenger Oligonucleotide or Dinucleotide Synthetase domain